MLGASERHNLNNPARSRRAERPLRRVGEANHTPQWRASGTRSQIHTHCAIYQKRCRNPGMVLSQRLTFESACRWHAHIRSHHPPHTAPYRACAGLLRVSLSEAATHTTENQSSLLIRVLAFSLSFCCRRGRGLPRNTRRGSSWRYPNESLKCHPLKPTGQVVPRCCKCGWSASPRLRW